MTAVEQRGHRPTPSAMATRLAEVQQARLASQYTINYCVLRSLYN